MNDPAAKILRLTANLAILVPLLIALLFVLKLALYSRRIKRNVTAGTMLGLVGRAESDIADEGLVFVRGELWPAHARTSIPSGARVRVTGFKQLALEVETLEKQ